MHEAFSKALKKHQRHFQKYQLIDATYHTEFGIDKLEHVNKLSILFV